jgi:putative transposase
MGDTLSLAKAIADAGWAQFVNFCQYKADWSGGGVLKVNRYFPSSKLCSGCGEKNKSLTLNIRQWVCMSCGCIHDRDHNAAVNILREATAGVAESHAGGDTSSAVRRSAPEAHDI